MLWRQRSPREGPHEFHALPPPPIRTPKYKTHGASRKYQGNSSRACARKARSAKVRAAWFIVPIVWHRVQ
jgi:hypothetical protein